MSQKMNFKYGCAYTSQNSVYALRHITAQSLIEQLLGRPVLDALGRNTTDIFASAADGYNGLSDLVHPCKDSSGRCIPRVYGGVYHVNRGDDEDEHEDFEHWFDVGENEEKNREAVL